VAGTDCLVYTDMFPNSAVPYCEKYYKTIMLVVSQTFKFL